MCTDRSPHPEPDEPWGLDNGAYRDYRAGVAPDRRYHRRLARVEARLAEGTLASPLLVVAPDLVGAAHHSLTWSDAFMRTRPSHDSLRWYLVVQDGIEPTHLNRRTEPTYAGLFLGGSDPWKRAHAARWAHLARERGWALHYGRCSTVTHLTRALTLGFDSADSACPLTRAPLLANFCAAWEKLHGL